ncbi:predicted protein [Chaetomium globosum CBS 148.51]|uniref:Uncharacterized protein n=1 Tax=Chaetomium globosum (strain ATCC 6205 / CBS 148.51 / DSM 1962 / NBRC 6347 / NRRL 1970) TaxID=306901 RepID=Q2H6R6_CHAGB|nr:uncharacterized protein CHGG_05649 [Chaetomium globosum CBS 148.51]EAQ89030.1 predicted protein [Chaetomium globosum CBS 148.51]
MARAGIAMVGVSCRSVCGTGLWFGGEWIDAWLSQGYPGSDPNRWMESESGERQELHPHFARTAVLSRNAGHNSLELSVRWARLEKRDI